MQLTKFLSSGFAKGVKGYLRESFPIRNGGYRCISRDDLQKYTNIQFESSKKAKAAGAALVRSVHDFKKEVLDDPVLRMGFNGALDRIPENGILGVATFDQVFDCMSNITVDPPKFHAAEITGVPFYAIFMDFLDSRWGQAFFSNPIVNRHLKNIFNEYQTMLKSEVSNKHMNDGHGGWFSPGKGPVGNECGVDASGIPYEKGAACFYDFEDYYIDKNLPNWGFDNWNDWFTRPLKAGRRPIDPATNVIVNSSDSYPLYYLPNLPSGITGQNPAYNVSSEAQFWLKDNQYSLYDMLGARPMGITSLVDHSFQNGTVYQAFLNPWCYHRWHSPVKGTVLKSYKLGGTYYLSNPGLPLGEADPNTENYINSQPMLSIVSVRQIFIIEMTEPAYYGNKVAVIEIGMAEVSSCHPTVIEGQQLNKGDQLGFFEFGGSSHAIIFDENLLLEFVPEIYIPEVGVTPPQPAKQLVNSKLATITGVKNPNKYPVPTKKPQPNKYPQSKK